MHTFIEKLPRCPCQRGDFHECQYEKGSDSKTKIFHLAKLTLAFWPPLNETPRSPTNVSSPFMRDFISYRNEFRQCELRNDHDCSLYTSKHTGELLPP